MMRLLTLVPKAPGVAPNQRFRHEQWAPHLSRIHGIDLEFSAFESPELTEILYQPGRRLRKARLVVRDALRRWSARHRARDFDGVVVLREAMLLGGAWLESSIARSGVPLIYDFDDAIWHVDTSGRNGLATLARMPWKVGRICRVASAVTVGNEYLAQYARRFSDSVHIVRTSIDVARFTVQPPPAPGRPFTIVWTGSHSTLRHLEEIRPAIERLGKSMPVVIRVICDLSPPPFANATLDFVRWRAESEAIDLAPGHVGIMPLPDTPLTRGKCGCKALQYMAISRPVVVAPVAINREIVRNEVNGLWASSLDDWYQQLRRLAADAELGERLGRAGRLTVEGEYTAEASAGAFAAVARAVVRRSGIAGRAEAATNSMTAITG
jgi:glycosyltransferase involved in cell wall biosynthesis